MSGQKADPIECERQSPLWVSHWPGLHHDHELVVLKEVVVLQVLAYVNRVRDVAAESVDNASITLEDIEANDVRCPDQEVAKLMYKGMHPPY